MTDQRPSYDDLLELVQQQQHLIQTLRDQITRLLAVLDEARPSGKRQAAPFRNGTPKHTLTARTQLRRPPRHPRLMTHPAQQPRPVHPGG
jgi:hypothetical protein